jgi:hypothetical protein
MITMITMITMIRLIRPDPAGSAAVTRHGWPPCPGSSRTMLIWW